MNSFAPPKVVRQKQYWSTERIRQIGFDGVKKEAAILVDKARKIAYDVGWEVQRESLLWQDPSLREENFPEIKYIIKEPEMCSYSVELTVTIFCKQD